MRRYQYYIINEDGDRDAYGANWIGQTFTPEITHVISKVKLKLFRVGDPGTITISIKITSANKPTGADLCIGTIEGTSITLDSNGEYYEITLGDGFELDKDVKYAIVVRAPDGDASNKLSWRADVAGALYPGGTYCSSSDSGVDWSTFSGTDAMFEEWGVGPPSPTTITWGNLMKSQISTEKIEAAILRLIQNHEDDANAHVETGESLYSHKASEIIDHVVRSIIANTIGLGEVQEQHRYSISAWGRLLATQPWTALEILRKTWTGSTGENRAFSLTFDGTYLYVGLAISPAKVFKIDPATMTVVGTWTGATGENLCTRLAYDGTYIHVALYLDPAKVIKIDPATMTTVDSWTGTADEGYTYSVLFDGTYLYAGLYLTVGDTRARVKKINISNMTTIATWTAGAGEARCVAFAFDGIHLYAGLACSDAKVIKLQTSDMTEVDRWTAPAGHDYTQSLCFDGTYLYAALQMTPAEVYQINPSTMATVDTWIGAAGQNDCFALVYDGSYIYAGTHVSPAQIVMIERTDMTTISTWTGAAGENDCAALIFDGKYVYIALDISPGKVIRKIMRNIDETDL